MNKPKEALIDAKVYPSQEKTIKAVNAEDKYGGAHNYLVKPCKGFVDGETKYEDFYMALNFVKKTDDGHVISGLQNEQLVHIMLDRQKKLNARFPSKYNDIMVKSLEIYLEACKSRIDDRISRGVMGDLKK